MIILPNDRCTGVCRVDSFGLCRHWAAARRDKPPVFKAAIWNAACV